MDNVIKVESNADVLAKKLERWAKVAPEEVRKTLGMAADLVLNEVDKHFHNPKMPRGVSGGFYGSWLGIKSGWLRRNMHKKMNVNSSGRFSAIVGTNMWYARKHEFGLDGMPERPFLRPSLAKKRPEVFEFIEKAMMKSYGK